MSFDFRLFIFFHGCMMCLMLARSAFSVGISFEIAIFCCVSVVAFVLSIRNRRKHGWRWPGSRLKDLLSALGLTALILFFLGAVLPGTAVFNPNSFPLLAVGGGILVFGVLSNLHVVHQKEEDFLRHCGKSKLDEPPLLQGPPLPLRKKALAAAFRIYFLAVWIAGVGYFWTFNAAYRGGSKQPTTTQTEALTVRSHTVYITPEQKKLVSLLQFSITIGFPSVIIVGAYLHLFLGVKVIPNREVEN